MRTQGRRVVIGLMALSLTACGSGGGGTTVSPMAELLQAKATLDAAQAFHFTLATAGVPQAKGTIITGGQGDLQRPDRLVGSFTVSVGGLQATVKVAAGGGKFYAELPFSSTFQPTNPASFGVANPAQLISPQGGLSSILSATEGATSGGQTRISGEVLDVVSGTVAGSAITVVPDETPATPVGLKAYIAPRTHELRQITLTGPIETTTTASFTVTLTNYGEHVNLAIPSS